MKTLREREKYLFWERVLSGLLWGLIIGSFFGLVAGLLFLC